MSRDNWPWPGTPRVSFDRQADVTITAGNGINEITYRVKYRATYRREPLNYCPHEDGPLNELEIESAELIAVDEVPPDRDSRFVWGDWSQYADELQEATEGREGERMDGVAC